MTLQRNMKCGQKMKRYKQYQMMFVMNFLFVAHSSPTSLTNNMFIVIIGVSVASAVLAVVIAVCLTRYFLKRKKKTQTRWEIAQGEAIV